MRRIALAAALTATLVGTASGCAVTGEPQQTAATVAVPIPDGGLTQTLVPAGDHFSRLTVTVATYGEPAPQGVLHVEVQGAGERRTVVVDGGQLGDNRAVPLVFPPVAGSAGERFTATFSWQGRDRVALWAAPSDAYPDGALAPVGGDLAFTVGHAGRLGGARDALGRVPGEAAEQFGRAPAFTAVWLVAAVALAVGVVRSARRSRA